MRSLSFPNRISRDVNSSCPLLFFFPNFSWAFRLGVGAPLPETHAPAQTRLVQKLEGGKRRARERENGLQAVTANKDEHEEEKDSAAESRAAGIAIRKRQRVDPFESGGKKKRTKAVVGPVDAVETARAKDSDVEMEEAPQLGPVMASDDATTRPGPKKKKKKKKKHLLESQSAQEHVAYGGAGGQAPPAPLDADITPHAESSDRSSLLEEWDGISQDQQGSRSGTPGSYSGMCFIQHLLRWRHFFLVLITLISNHFSCIIWRRRSATQELSEITTKVTSTTSDFLHPLGPSGNYSSNP